MNERKKWSFFGANAKRLSVVMAANFAANILPGVFNIILYLIVIQLVVPVLNQGQYSTCQWCHVRKSRQNRSI